MNILKYCKENKMNIIKFLSTLFLVVILINSFLISDDSIDNFVFYNPKFTEMKNKDLTISKNIEIICSKEISTKLKTVLDSLKSTTLENGKNNKEIIKIYIEINKDLHVDNVEYKEKLKNKESFILNINDNNIKISSVDYVGLLNGLSTLETLLIKNKGVLTTSKIIDYPNHSIRALHISLWPAKIDDFKTVIKLARLNHFNMIIILNHFGVDLDSLKHLKAYGVKWTKEEFVNMIDFAKENGMEVVPALELLSHQDKFMSNQYPQFMYNKDTYDPRYKELYEKVVFPAINELLELTKANKFLIGHDEIAGGNNWFYEKKILNKNEKQLPAELFLEDVKILNTYLISKGIEPWMWSDMLYQKEEFPSMNEVNGSLNANNEYSNIRTEIPKNIILLPWHYEGKQKNFPTASLLTDLGFNILGTTFENKETIINYSNYVINLPLNTKGMVASTWYGISGEKKLAIYEIIKISGESFWNAK
jgi:hypothetical protein